jgi:hypothetical protein
MVPRSRSQASVTQINVGLSTWQEGQTYSWKSSVLRAITSCSPLNLSWRFGVTCRLHVHSWRVSLAELWLYFLPESPWFLTWIFLQPWTRRHVPLKCQLTFNGLHSVISQEHRLFISTGVRTSNPTTREEELSFGNGKWRGKAVVSYFRVLSERTGLNNESISRDNQCSARASNRYLLNTTVTAKLTCSVPMVKVWKSHSFEMWRTVAWNIGTKATEAAGSSETLEIYLPSYTASHPNKCNLHNHHRENVKSDITNLFFRTDKLGFSVHPPLSILF